MARALNFQWRNLSLLCGLVLVIFLLVPAPIARADSEIPPGSLPTSAYSYGKPSRDGIGKFYLGREIAQVMGHLGAGWLERSTRQFEEQPQRLIKHLNLPPTAVVADIGAGTGYFSFRISPLVPQGRVVAVDVQPEMVEILTELTQQNQASNIEPHLGTETDPHLAPNSIDLALLVDAYHEFEYPREMMQAIARSLKPTGRVMLVEYRGENPLVPIKALHKMTQRQVKREMAAAGLEWLQTENFLPQQHVLIFGRKQVAAQP